MQRLKIAEPSGFTKKYYCLFLINTANFIQEGFKDTGKKGNIPNYDRLLNGGAVKAWGRGFRCRLHISSFW